MAPSDWDAIFLAYFGVDIPNSTATGTSVTSRTKSTIALIFVVIFERTPVTPKEDT